MHVRCPHCRNPIEVVDDSSLSDVECPSCGSSFSLVGDVNETRQWSAKDGVGEAATSDRPSEQSTIAHFKLTKKLGMGAFGTVWCALDAELDRTVAIKIPRRGQLGPEESEQFLREARAAAQLNHPNIVSVYEVGREDGQIYIVSNFVQGETLADRIASGPLSSREAAELCAKVADALHHAHEAGVIHRDLKPSNIMLDEKCEPHVMDFGLAKREAGEITMTIEGQILGTPAYMSPEQAQGEAHNADRRSDVFSLGVILFELLTGERPFRGSQRMLLYQIINDNAPSPRKLNSNIPRDLETICLKCLETDPNRRYQSAQALVEELRRYLDGEPILARPISQFARTWRWCKRNPAVASLLCLTVLTLATGGGLATWQWRLAVHAREQADQESKAAEIAKRTAQLSEKRARRQLYVADMNLAAQAWHAVNLQRSRDLLARYLSEPELRGLRQFEWYCLWQLTSGDQKSFLHPTPVYEVSFTPGGGELLTNRTAEPGALLPSDLARAWGLATGRELRIPVRAQGAIDLWQLSPDGRTVAAWGRDGQVQIRNAESDDTIRTLPSANAPTVLEFSPDSRTLAACTADSTIAFWDVASGNLRVTGKLPEGERLVMTFSPDAKILATRSSSFSATWLQLHDVSTGELLHEFAVNPCYHSSMAFSPDSKTLAVGERDVHLISLFDVVTGEKRSSLSGHTDGLHSVVFSPRGELLASSSDDLTVRLWDVDSGALRHTLRGHRAWAWPMAFSPDGSLLASGGMDNTVMLWDTETGEPVGEPLIGHSNTIWSLAFSRTGRELASASADGSVRLWNVSFDPTANLLVGHTDSVSSLAVSKNGVLATASRDGTVRRWNLVTRERIGEPLAGHKQPAHHLIGVALSPDGALLALGAPNGIKLWQADTGSLIYHLDQQPARCVAFSPDGLVLATGSDAGDNTIALRNAKTGEIRKVLRGHRGTVRTLAFSPDGRWLASSGFDPRIILWNVQTGEAKGQPLSGHRESVRSLAFSPDGTILASAGDSTARLWDVKTGSPIAVFEGHANWAFSVAFTPDGKTLASGSTDGTVKLWDVELHEQRATFASARGAGVLSVAFSTDGKTLVAGDDNGTVKLWRAKDAGRE